MIPGIWLHRTEAAMVILEDNLSNEEFLKKHARAGRIGLAGGITLIDKAIVRAERHVDADKQWSHWSHAFLFQGQRVDGHQWVIESDLQINRKHIALGVQENRVSKYHDQGLYTTLAVMDFQLPQEAIDVLLREGLEMVALKARYSMRELIGTMVALRYDKRDEGNRLARENSFYCSAFVRHLFRAAKIDLTPGVEVKHTTPEDIVRTLVPHTTYVLQGPVATSTVKTVVARVRERRQAIVSKIRGAKDR
jgi:hypothetical protein